MFQHNSFNSGERFKRPLTREEKRRAKLAKEKKLRDMQAWRESKHHAVTTEVVAELAKKFGVEIANPKKLANELAGEHQIFANIKSPEELEDNAPQTVVGIGEYKKGRIQGIPMLYNEKKRGLGFPGGRVRFGQHPISRLKIEMKEEAGLKCEVLGEEPVSEFFIGEEKHIFSAFEVKFTGGKPRVNPTEDEPITVIVFVKYEILLAACRENKSINVKGIGPLPILRSHKLVFLDLVRVRNSVKEATNVV